MSVVSLHPGSAKGGESPAGGDAGSVAAAPAPAAPSSGNAAGQAQQQPSATESAQTPAKRPYPAPAEVPTQAGPRGMRFDFNDGCRVSLPEAAHPWRVRLSDLDTGNVLFETELKTGRINSAKRYFIRFRLEIWQNGESLLSHDYVAKDREVMIQFPVGTLGDPMGWFPYAVKFQERHGCKLTCALGEKLIALYRDAYPGINFVTHEEVKPERYYATYSLGLFFDDKDSIFQPCDFRHVGLHRTAGYILGVDPAEKPPRVVVSDDSRPIPEPYVVIAVQSTTQCKYWNNPNGWREVIAFLSRPATASSASTRRRPTAPA
jgi:autotransporter strand-loop-strand O-heptosyltransferase